MESPRKFLLTAIPLLLLSAGRAQAPPGSAGQAGKLTRHPYLQLATRSSVVLVWRTRGPTRPVVRFGDRADRLDRTAAAAGITVRLAKNVTADPAAPRLHSAPADTHQYEAVINGLQPDTRYCYAVFDGDERLAGGDPAHSFRTLPAGGTPRRMRFWVVGDSGTGLAPQRRVFEAMQRHVAQEGRPLDGFLHLGDIAYASGTDVEFQRNVFEVYTSLLRHTVIWPAMGNHEGATSRGTTGIGPYYDAFVLPTRGEAGGLPSGREAFYSFDHANAHFVCLDSHDLSRRPDGEMAIWLRADLERTRADWIIAYWHHPPYTKGTHDSDTELQLAEMRTCIMPILESGGVDLVLAGHSHIYERSMLIDGAYATPTTAEGVVLDDGDGRPDGDGPYRKSAGLLPHRGTVAVVAGHGGAIVGSRPTRMPIMRSVFVENGSVLLDIDGDTLTGTMLNVGGVVRDRFALVKRGEVPVGVVDHPWHGLGPEITAAAPEFPDRMLVRIRPRPDAPDARIHYTVDGSEPSLRSPLYHSPLLLDATTRVRALSTWRQGRRISPLSERTFRRLPGGTVLSRILAGGDDVEENPAGRILPGQTNLELGQAGPRPQRVGLRFAKVDVPRGSRIKRAFVQFRARLANIKPASLRIQVAVAGDVAPFGIARFSLSRLAAGAPAVEWAVPGWKRSDDAGPAQQTPDLSGLLQRVIDHPHWDQGQSLAVIITGRGTRTACAFDRGADQAPYLWVELEQ